MNQKFIKKQFKLVGVEGKINFNGDYPQQIAQLQEQLFSRLDEIEFIINQDSYTAYWYYKSDCSYVNQEPEIYYLAAMEVSKIEQVPSGIVSVILPESEFVVFEENERGEVGGPHGYVYSTYLPESGRELNPVIPGDLEIYPSRYHIEQNDICEIYIPIK